jgi:1-acyl-sn-glycerol-3-phosphate acyltransferase
MLILKTYKALFGLQHCIHGLENLPRGPKILTANHPNASDGLQLPLIFKERITVIAQEDLFRLPVFGWILTHAGHIPVQPRNRGATLKQACRVLSEGRSILIFPEGALNPENKEVKAGTGAVRLSLISGAPIIPVGILVSVRDTWKIGPVGKYQSGRWQFRGKFNVRMGSAWTPELETGSKQEPLAIQELTGCLMDRIHLLVQQSAQEE